jgi:hypothetical protein
MVVKHIDFVNGKKLVTEVQLKFESTAGEAASPVVDLEPEVLTSATSSVGENPSMTRLFFLLKVSSELLLSLLFLSLSCYFPICIDSIMY